MRNAKPLLEQQGSHSGLNSGLGPRVSLLTARVKLHLDTFREMVKEGRQAEFYDAVKRSYNSNGDLPSLYMLRMLGEERWSAAGEFIGELDPARRRAGLDGRRGRPQACRGRRRAHRRGGRGLPR
jgi:hypothetical protein